MLQCFLTHFSNILFTMSFSRMNGCSHHGTVFTKQYALGAFTCVGTFEKAGDQSNHLRRYTWALCWRTLPAGTMLFWKWEFNRHSGRFPYSSVLCAAAGYKQIQGIPLLLTAEIKLDPCEGTRCSEEIHNFRVCICIHVQNRKQWYSHLFSHVPC